MEYLAGEVAPFSKVDRPLGELGQLLPAAESSRGARPSVEDRRSALSNQQLIDEALKRPCTLPIVEVSHHGDDWWGAVPRGDQVRGKQRSGPVVGRTA